MLKWKRNKPDDFPDFEESHFVPVKDDATATHRESRLASKLAWYHPVPGAAWWRQETGPYPGFQKPPYVRRADRNIPAGTVPMEEGARVPSKDGERVGDVERVFTKVGEEMGTELPKFLRRREYLDSKGEDKFLVFFKIHRELPPIGDGPQPNLVIAMDDTEAIRQKLRELFESQNLGVLSTQRSGQPYASLIAFYASDDLKNFYFVTPKTTRKFQNLKTDPRVAILVDSSTNQSTDFHRAIAVTMVGEASEVDVSKHPSLVKKYLEKHPYLEDFVRSPSIGLVKVSARSYFLVQNFQNVIELHLNS